MHVPSADTIQRYARRSLDVDTRSAVVRGVAAGAAVVALTAVSAAVSAARERASRS